MKGGVVCWLRAISLFGRGGLWLFCLGGICKVERGVRYSFSGLEIIHGGEGGDVELGARTSEHIFVFVFDPLPLNSLSLLIVHSIIHSFISYIACVALHLLYCSSLYAWLACVCASLILNHKSFT